MKNLVLAFCTGALLLGCAGNTSQTSLPGGACSTQETCLAGEAQVVGVYEAKLPCASCSGIEARLTLNKDATFNTEMTYLSKDKYKEARRGTYAVIAGNVVTTDNYKEKQSYKIDGENLIMLDFEGKEPTGELKDFYVFKKVK